MKLSLIAAFLLMAPCCFAQRQNVYFLKNNGKYLNTRDSADYIRLVKEPDRGSVLYNISEYYKNGTRKLIGKSITIDPPKFEDTCTTYYKTGVRKSLTTFKKGRAVGKSYEFYPNGKPYLVKEYPDDDQPFKDIFVNDEIKECYDSLGTALIIDGNGHYKGYDDDFRNVVEEGEIKNRKKNGLWNGNFKIAGVVFTEHYNDGKLITGTATDENGKLTSYSGQRGTPPQFPGGYQGFGNYLGSNIKYPIDARKKSIQGSVIISFVVERDGKITRIMVAKSVSPSLDEEAVRVLENSPAWIPAMQFGRPVSVAYSVPIRFTLN